MKILIAEDNPVDAIILRNILEHEEHAVVVASDGRAALEALSQHPDIAAIFADIRMPDLDGLGLVEAVRERTETAGIPVIFVSGIAEAEYVRRAVALGAGGYLLKPINEPSRVLNLLHKALQPSA